MPLSFDRDGPTLRQFMPGTRLHDHDLTTVAKPTFASARVNTIDQLTAGLQHRFDDAQTAVLEATQVANFRLWPEADEEGASELV